MKDDQLEKFLEQSTPEFYSFAFVLIPDDLQAGQLVIDSLAAFLISKKYLLENDGYISQHMDIKIEIIHLIYDLAKKRFHQVHLSLDELNNVGFYTLDFEQRAALYLKDKAKYDNNSIALILNKTGHEVTSFLYSARVKLVENLPVTLHFEGKI